MKNPNLRLLGVVIIGILLFVYQMYKQQERNIVTLTSLSFETPNTHFSFPLKYFSSKDIVSGSGGSSSTDLSDWDSAVFDSGYRSFPTTTISIKGYENTDKELPKLPTDEEWNNLLNSIEAVGVRDSYIESAKENGDLGKRYKFIDYGYDIGNINADITGDGINENIIAIYDGGNHGPSEYQIIKDNKIIFTIKTGDFPIFVGVIPDPSSNGFTVKWNSSEMLTNGYCCPTGHISTRFVYENGKFMPMYEKKELYFEVNNSHI